MATAVANPFDAFDAAPASAPVAAPTAPAANPFDAFDAPKGNPFDAFDALPVPTSNVVADTSKRLGRAGVEGTLGGLAGILQAVKMAGDKLGLPHRGGDLVQNDNGLVR
jgi:hypothetical protein